MKNPKDHEIPQQIVAIDAVMEEQYASACIIRDLQKAYVGFRGIPGVEPVDNIITTGGWGCGAFVHVEVDFFDLLDPGRRHKT